ncbi:FecR family protein [Bacteroides oleiciplenus]|uniref:FecR family protein n=1 Tax=Bacteroides oleiciplenus TaxID=626931 RepID=A0A3E5BEN6_9BACE|nr:FecR family protein [Bacteroides oleiciplenus]RGN35825.1 FecR family protein [Bacteroides oleiciplenus]
MDTKNMNKPTEQQIQEVLAGIATSEDAQIVVKWFATDEGAAYLSKSVDRDAEQIKLGYEELYVNHDIPSEEMFACIFRNIRRKRIRRIAFRVAAVIIPFIVLMGLFIQVDTRVDLFGDSGYEEIYVPKGERLQMMFQDGTRAYINSDSHLRYPKKFALSSRKVYLEGEAYFVVSKNSHRPFIVNLNGPAVHVLGTSFGVQAYPENKDITVCLDEGHVNLTLSSEKKYPMKPGEKLVYDKESERCTITRSTDIHLSSLWKKNVIAFKDAPLSEVIKVLNRWYDVDFKIEDEAAWDVYFTLTSENTLLEKVLQDLEKISPLRFEYKEVEKEVIVMGKGEELRSKR